MSVLMNRTVECADLKWNEKNAELMLIEGELGREPLCCLLYKQMGELLDYIMLSARYFVPLCNPSSLLTPFLLSCSLLPSVFSFYTSMYAHTCIFPHEFRCSDQDGGYRPEGY